MDFKAEPNAVLQTTLTFASGCLVYFQLLLPVFWRYHLAGYRPFSHNLVSTVLLVWNFPRDIPSHWFPLSLFQTQPPCQLSPPAPAPASPRYSTLGIIPSPRCSPRFCPVPRQIPRGLLTSPSFLPCQLRTLDRSPCAGSLLARRHGAFAVGEPGGETPGRGRMTMVLMRGGASRGAR